jgi:hypothetical protein
MTKNAIFILITGTNIEKSDCIKGEKNLMTLQQIVGASVLLFSGLAGVFFLLGFSMYAIKKKINTSQKIVNIQPDNQIREHQVLSSNKDQSNGNIKLVRKQEFDRIKFQSQKKFFVINETAE